MFDATFWAVLSAATLTAVATGLGALPFLFVRRLSLFWVSIANSAAGALMFAAIHSLVAEDVTISPARLVAGMVIGLVGILIGKMLIVEREHASIAGLVKLDARSSAHKARTVLARNWYDQTIENVAGCPASAAGR